MTRVKNFFLNDETGRELSEYAIAGALITVACIGAFGALNGGITTKINSLKAATAS